MKSPTPRRSHPPKTLQGVPPEPPAASAPARGRLLRAALAWRGHALPVLALLAVVTAVLYWRALRCGLVSDAWEVLGVGAMGLPDALFVTLSYHIIPVTFLLSSILWKVFGLWEPGYQLVNLAELGLSAWMLYFLGLRLFGRPQVALLGALLLVANASFYEVTCWPVIGNFQILAGMLQIAGVLAALRAAASPRPWPWALLFALLAVTAFFTYEPAVSLLAAGVLAAALIPSERGGSSWRGMLRRTAPVMTAAILAFIPMIVVKLVAAGSGHTPLFLPDSAWMIKFRLFYLVRGFIGLFTLRGSDAVTVTLFHFGSPRPFESPELVRDLAIWVVVLAVATLVVLFKARQPAVRWLLLWFWIHMLSVSVATVMVSRLTYLAALPASLLLAWAIYRGAGALAGLLARLEPAGRRPRAMASITATLSALAFGLLAVGAKIDIDAASALHREATVATRRIVELLRSRTATGSPAASLTLVNMPAKLVRDGVGSYAFVNGLYPMLELAGEGAVPRNSIKLVTTVPTAAPGPFANGTRPVTLPDLVRRVQDPSHLVLWFDPRARTVVELNRLSWKAPREYTPASAPLLPWGAPPWDWMDLQAGVPLDLPLELPEAGSWGAVKFLRAQEPVHFDVVESGVTRLAVRPLSTANNYWSILLFPIAGEERRTVLTLLPETGVRMTALWTWSPPSRYTPEAAPFLSWWLAGPEPVFAVPETLRLPVACGGRDAEKSGCGVRLEYLAEPGRELVLAVEGGEKRELTVPAGSPPVWTTLTVAAGPPAPLTVLRIEPRGALPPLLRAVAAAASSAEGGSRRVPQSDTLELQDASSRRDAQSVRTITREPRGS